MIKYEENDVKSAMSRALEYSAPVMTLGQLEQALVDAKKAAVEPLLQSDRSFWVKRLEKLRNDPDFIRGKHPQSIDKILSEIVEMRSLLHAILNTNIAGRPFSSYNLFERLRVSSTYDMVCKFGKLTSMSKNDISLRNYWLKFSKYLKGYLDEEIVDKHDKEFKKRFTKENSKTVYFRHHVVAHNAESISLCLDSFDDDLRFLIVTWSELTWWSSLGYYEPWLDERHVFDGYEHFCNATELEQLKSARQQYIDKVIDWSKYSISGKKTQKSAFGSISVSISAAI